MEKLVVIGNGMAGIGCVEQILKHATRVRHHHLWRRDARELQPHPAFVGFGWRKIRGRNYSERSGMVSEARNYAASWRAHHWH